MRHGFRNTLVLCMMLAVGAAAIAGDPVEIRLKDGSRWRGETSDRVELVYLRQGAEFKVEGTLLRAEDWFITIEARIAGEPGEHTIFKSDIISMETIGGGERVAPAPGGAKERGIVASRETRAPSRRAAPAPAGDGPGVFVLPLKGMVGLYFRHDEMEKIAEEADKWGPGQIIVLLIDSPGGAIFEMEKIHDTLAEIRKRHRLVAWIKEAISAACATAINCHEIYFMTEGTAGAMTAFNGMTGQAWRDEDLDEWMRRAGDWMEEGGRSRYIAEAMIHNTEELSYDKNEVTGEVTFYDDLSGQYVLSRQGENLVFTASTAVHCGFADGIADTEEELAELLDLPAWHEKSDYGREIAGEWHDTVDRAQEQLQLISAQLEYKGTGSGDPLTRMGTRKRLLQDVLRWYDRCEMCVLMSGFPPKDVLEREIRQLQKQIADYKRSQRRRY